MWALEADFRAGSPSGPLYREGLGLALAARLLAGEGPAPAPRGGLSPIQLARMTEYVEANLSGDVSLTRLARVAGVSGAGA